MEIQKDKLKNAPLVEAIFEFRWKLGRVEERLFDPNYKLLPGALYEKVRENFPYHEPMPASQMPDDLAAYSIQHRFRRAKDDWPLIQLGPGILTINDTANYVWKDFKENISFAISELLKTYPKSQNKLEPYTLTLRYIDAVDFNFVDGNIFDFLKQNLRLDISIHDDIFSECKFDKRPLGIDLKFAFNSSRPKGLVELRFRQGENKGQNAIIWDTIVHSGVEGSITNYDETLDWLDQAHDVTHRLFFKMIEGELRSKFE